MLYPSSAVLVNMRFHLYRNRSKRRKLKTWAGRRVPGEERNIGFSATGTQGILSRSREGLSELRGTDTRDRCELCSEGSRVPTPPRRRPVTDFVPRTKRHLTPTGLQRERHRGNECACHMQASILMLSTTFRLSPPLEPAVHTQCAQAGVCSVRPPKRDQRCTRVAYVVAEAPSSLSESPSSLSFSLSLRKVTRYWLVYRGKTQTQRI